MIKLYLHLRDYVLGSQKKTKKNRVNKIFKIEQGGRVLSTRNINVLH